jgi:hypothetical protein
VLRTTPLPEAAKALVDRALARTKDNATAVVADVVAPETDRRAPHLIGAVANLEVSVRMQ